MKKILAIQADPINRVNLLTDTTILLIQFSKRIMDQWCLVPRNT